MTRILLSLLLLIPWPSFAADGIVPNKQFRVPFSVDGADLKLGAKASVAIGSDGRASLRVLFPKAGDVEEKFYWIVPADGGPTPQPNPQPNPQPDPQPQPQPNKAEFLYLIHETKDVTPPHNVVQMDTAWKQKAEALGIRWVIVDKDQSAKSLPNATALAIKTGLPAVVWLDSAGLAKAEKCPATPPLMLSFVERIGGAK